MRKLSELSLEELWQIFPISLVESNPEWNKWYAEMEMELLKIIPSTYVYSINHIGSTAIKNIQAKNIIDILIELENKTNMGEVSSILNKHGFEVMSTTSDRISLNKGYTPDGFSEKVYHVHLRCIGDNDEIYFKDYLNLHPTVAREYEDLKVSLSKKYEFNRDKYTEEKTNFINKYTKLAKTDQGQ